MVVGILFNAKKAERHPFEMMLIGFFYTSVSILLSSWIFPEYSSLVMVFFTVISCLYVVQGAIKLEEDKERIYKQERWLLKQHYTVLVFFLFLFLGFVFSFTFWTMVLPEDRVVMLFDLQSTVVDGIRSMVATGNSVNGSIFSIILINNLKVLSISLIFALFYGAGAIFVLVWNASVMGFVIGELVRTKIGFIALPIAFTKYFLHGIPEMLAYFIGALAGGIIYVALWKGDFLEVGRAKRIIIDCSLLFLIAVGLLIVSALLEIYVSPLI